MANDCVPVELELHTMKDSLKLLSLAQQYQPTKAEQSVIT